MPSEAEQDPGGAVTAELINPSFTCCLCGATSWNPHDVEHGWCDRCHNYVPGIVFRDSPTMPGWRFGAFYGTAESDDHAVAVRPDGAVGLLGSNHIEPEKIDGFIDLLRAAQKESQRNIKERKRSEDQH